MKLATAGLVITFVCSPLLATTPSQPTLTFEDRVKARTRMPERLVELYAALGNDPFLIADYIFGYDLGDGLLGIRHHGGDTRKLGHATRVRDRLPMAASEKSRIEETPP